MRWTSGRSVSVSSASLARTASLTTVTPMIGCWIWRNWSGAKKLQERSGLALRKRLFRVGSISSSGCRHALHEGMLSAHNECHDIMEASQAIDAEMRMMDMEAHDGMNQQRGVSPDPGAELPAGENSGEPEDPEEPRSDNEQKRKKLSSAFASQSERDQVREAGRRPVRDPRAVLWQAEEGAAGGWRRRGASGTADTICVSR